MTEAGERDSVQDQLCARIEELESEKMELNEQVDSLQEERGTLAAHLERLQRALKATMVSGWSDPAEEALVEVFSDSPQTSLARMKAQWQAEALGHVLAEVLTAVEADTVRAHLRNAMRKLRRQAEGGEK